MAEAAVVAEVPEEQINLNVLNEHQFYNLIVQQIGKIKYVKEMKSTQQIVIKEVNYGIFLKKVFQEKFGKDFILDPEDKKKIDNMFFVIED